MAEYSIRLANKHDLLKLAQIEKEAGKRFSGMGLVDHLLGQTLPPAKLIELIEKKQVLIACVKNVPVGFAAVSVIGKNAYLEEIDVLPEHGRQGHGARLIQLIIEWATLNELNALILSTFLDVQWNAPYYQKFGFRVLDVHESNDDLKQKRREEKEHGMPIDKRVFMQLDLHKSI